MTIALASLFHGVSMAEKYSCMVRSPQCHSVLSSFKLGRRWSHHAQATAARNLYSVSELSSWIRSKFPHKGKALRFLNCGNTIYCRGMNTEKTCRRKKKKRLLLTNGKTDKHRYPGRVSDSGNECLFYCKMLNATFSHNSLYMQF